MYVESHFEKKLARSLQNQLDVKLRARRIHILSLPISLSLSKVLSYLTHAKPVFTIFDLKLELEQVYQHERRNKRLQAACF